MLDVRCSMFDVRIELFFALHSSLCTCCHFPAALGTFSRRGAKIISAANAVPRRRLPPMSPADPGPQPHREQQDRDCRPGWTHHDGVAGRRRIDVATNDAEAMPFLYESAEDHCILEPLLGLRAVPSHTEQFVPSKLPHVSERIAFTSQPAIRADKSRGDNEVRPNRRRRHYPPYSPRPMHPCRRADRQRQQRSAHRHDPHRPLQHRG